MKPGLHARFELTPFLALAAFAALVALPTLYASALYKAGPQQYNTVVVRANDTLWTLAAAHGKPGTDIQTTLDEIIAANHLNGATILPGNHLRIPR